MRYLPLTQPDREAMLAVIGARSIDDLFVDVPEAARLDGPIRGLPMHATRNGGRTPHDRARAQEPRRGRRAVLPRLRRVSPPRPRRGRSSDPARRVPDRLHALPARNRAGHAADAVRVPDAGRAAARHRCRQRLDVRRLDRVLGGDRHGAADHQARQGDPVVGAAPALRLGRQDDGEVSPATCSTRALPTLPPRPISTR